MSDLTRRLMRLEAAAYPEEFLDWDMQDQLDEVLDCLFVHRAGRSKQSGTDRQINLVGLLCAAWELGEAGGEHEFFSGLKIRLTPDGESFRVDASRLIAVEDLPDGVREYWRRMDPVEQPERERWLYEHREERKSRSELAKQRITWRETWREEHGYDTPAPEHLLPGGGR